MTRTTFLADDESTRAAGAVMAERLLPFVSQAAHGLLVFLQGPLGAGKSTWVRGLLRAAGVTGVMPSPTYSLVEVYQLRDLQILHIDAYRLGDAMELEYLGIEQAFSPGTLILVEWPGKIRLNLPTPSIEITLAYAELDENPLKTGRTITMTVNADLIRGGFIPPIEPV